MTRVRKSVFHGRHESRNRLPGRRVARDHGKHDGTNEGKIAERGQLDLGILGRRRIHPELDLRVRSTGSRLQDRLRNLQMNRENEDAHHKHEHKSCARAAPLSRCLPHFRFMIHNTSRTFKVSATPRGYQR